MNIVANFQDIITKHYFDFEGRARRSVFWYFVLANLIVAIVLNIIGSILHMGGLLGGLYSLATLLPNLGLAVRRLHDTNRSGWWIFIGLIPIIGWIALIIFYVQEGTKGANQFGPDPKA